MKQKTDIARFFPPGFFSLIFAIAFVFFTIADQPLFTDPDAAWHIISGDTVRAAHGWPATNLWAFTAIGQKWYIVSWAWDIIISLVHQMGGLFAVFVFTQAFMAGLMAVLAYCLSKREGLETDVIILILWMTCLSFLEFVAPRPQAASYLFIVLFHHLLHKSRSEENWRSLRWLPPIMLLWVNMHGSFFIGFALLGAYGLEALYHRSWPWFKRMFAIGAVCLLVSLINPYGIHMIDAVMRVLHSVITRYIIEWMPFLFSYDRGISAWLLLFILVSSMRDRTIPLADKILTLAWLLAMLQSMRNASIFIIVSVPYVALSTQHFLNQIEHLRTRRADIALKLQAPNMRILMGLLAVFIVGVTIPMTDTIRKKNYVVDADADPRPAINWLAEHVHNARILNDYNLGGVIIYQTHGTFPIFVDGRAGHAYSEEVLRDYLIVEHMDLGWVQVLDAYHIDGVIFNNNRAFAQMYAKDMLKGKWQRIYVDSVAGIYVRQEIADRLLLPAK